MNGVYMVWGRSAVLQGISESLQHYTKMHKAKYADHSLYGAQPRLLHVLLITLFTTAHAANYYCTCC